MVDAVKSAIPASDEQSQIIYIHQTSSNTSSNPTEENSVGNNNNESDNVLISNNELNMLIEQSLDHHNETVDESNGSDVGTVTQTTGVTSGYVNAPNGLFPSPLSKTAKTSQISRLKFKFKFLGKFMAKAVMDSRMVR
jgi:hypothetical protein